MIYGLIEEGLPYKQEDLVSDQSYQVTINKWGQENSDFITVMTPYPWCSVIDMRARRHTAQQT